MSHTPLLLFSQKHSCYFFLNFSLPPKMTRRVSHKDTCQTPLILIVLQCVLQCFDSPRVVVCVAVLLFSSLLSKPQYIKRERERDRKTHTHPSSFLPSLSSAFFLCKILRSQRAIRIYKKSEKSALQPLQSLKSPLEIHFRFSKVSHSRFTSKVSHLNSQSFKTLKTVIYDSQE